MGKTPTLDCLGMGIIPFDLLFTVPEYPPAGKKIDASGFYAQGGGPVPNVVIGLSRMGYRTSLIACIGDDPFGRLAIEELRQERVDHRLMIVKKLPSALAAGWIEQGSGRRTMVLSRQVVVRPNDIRLDRLPRPRLVHLDGRDMPATLKLARWAKRIGAVVSFDIGSIRNDVSDVFGLVDHLVVADAYALPFTGATTGEEAVERLRRVCPGVIVVTEGIHGSVGREPTSPTFIHQPAYRVESVDTTGAGDCYHTGYLHGLLRGESLAVRMFWGSAAAALKCTRPGARTGIPTESQLRAFVKRLPPTYPMR